MDEHYRCERVLQVTVLGLRDSQEALDEKRLNRIIREATGVLNSSPENQAASTLFCSPAVQLTSSQATVVVSGVHQDAIISVLKDQKILLQVPVKSVQKIHVADGNSSHMVIIAHSGSVETKFIADGSSQLVVWLNLPSQKQTETLMELLEVLRSFSPPSNPDNRYLVMSMPKYEDPKNSSSSSQQQQSVSIYEPSTSAPLKSNFSSSNYDYEPSTHAWNQKSVVEISKLIESEKSFVAQFEHCISKIRSPVEILNKMKNIAALHQSIVILLETADSQSLIKYLQENLKTISDHSRCFDHVSVYGTRSPNLKVDIVTRLCSLKVFLDANTDAYEEKAEVMDVLSETIRHISDRQILLQIDQDKFNVLKCGEVMHQGNLFQVIKKKPVAVYSILTRELLILTSPNFMYRTHVITEKMTSAIAYKESTTEFIITLEAKVSENKLHLKANDCNSLKTWLNCLNYIMKQNVELYF